MTCRQLLFAMLLLMPGARAQQALPLDTESPEAAKPLVIATSLTRSSLMINIEQQLRVAYRKLGYQISLAQLPSGRSLSMTNAGMYDGELFRIEAVGAEFPNLLKVPVPLARIELKAFTLAARPLAADWQHERKLRIGMVRGFRLAMDYPVSGQVVLVTSAQQAVQMLLQDRIDVLLDDEATIRAVLGPEFSRLQMAPEVLASAELFHFIHRKHQDLLKPLSDALRQLK